MTREELKTALQYLETIRYEWTCLIPRLSGQFQRNAQHCKERSEELIALLSKDLPKILVDDTGGRWEVEEAVDDAAAWQAISHARVTGSVGHTDLISENGGPEKVLAKVHRVDRSGVRVKPN